VREYWAKQFTVYPGATEHLFTWNDMNEPSVFNGPEISMPRDNIHHGDVEHRENHNMYEKHLYARSTFSQRFFVTLRAGTDTT
jgi:alpha-glucosidase (family GH31 glycosyl hydrolase)